MEIGRKQRVSETRTMTAAASPINFLFAGQFRSTVRRPRAKDSITFEPFNCLPLEVHQRHIGSVEDGLHFLARPEVIDAHLTKYTTISRQPMVLILQLKRIVYNKDTGQPEKVPKFITYPERLLISRSCCTEHSVEDGQPTYRLVAVIYHHGRGADGGHYTADVRKSFKPDEPWQHINDAVISKTSLAQVLADKGSHCSAYLLLYQRTKDSKHQL